MSDDLNDVINKNLSKIDFGDLDKISQSLGSSDFGLFSGDSFAKKIGQILSGEFSVNYPNIWGGIFSLVGGVLQNVLPLIVLIVGISILSGFIQHLRADNQGEGVRDVIHFATYVAIVSVVLYAVADVTVMAGKTLTSIKTQMDIIFPILLTLMATIGGTVSVSVYQPAIVMLSMAVMQIFTYVIMPLFIITLVFSVVGNLSNNTKYDKFVSFFSSLYKWILGLTFTIFLGFLTIQGITAGAHDGVSVRAAKFTMSSYVPFLGGYLSQGFDLIMASSILIKNAVGVAGLYILLGVVLQPIIKIAVLILGLKLAAAITQPIADSRISNFLSSVTKAFSMLVAILVGAAFMYFITIGLIIMTGNFL
jgi:stage III sporulation protein AE